MKYRDPQKARIVPDLLTGRAVVEVDATATNKDGTSRKKPDHRAHAELLIQVRDMLRSEGCHVRVIDSKPAHVPDGRGGWRTIPGRHKGMLDLIATVPPLGRLLAIDAKVAPDKLRPEQADEVTAIRAAGGVAGAAYSLEEARRLLKEARR